MNSTAPPLFRTLWETCQLADILGRETNAAEQYAMFADQRSTRHAAFVGAVNFHVDYHSVRMMTYLRISVM